MSKRIGTVVCTRVDDAAVTRTEDALIVSAAAEGVELSTILDSAGHLVFEVAEAERLQRILCHAMAEVVAMGPPLAER